MRILCLTPWFPAVPGAQAGSFILDSVQALQAAGHAVQVQVCQPWKPALAGWLQPDWRVPRLQVAQHDPALHVRLLQYPSIPRNLAPGLSHWLLRQRLQPVLARRIDEFKPDVLLVHTEQPAMAALPLATARKLPLVVVVHGINTSRRLDTPAERRRLRIVLRAAQRVVLVGEPLLAHCAGIAGDSSNFRIVHNGFRAPPPGCVKEAAPWPHQMRLISVSNLVEGKGVDLNLRALAQLAQEGLRDWRYTVVGAGSECAALESLAQQLGIARQVHFVGAVPHAAVYPLLADADVFVLPSWREAFGVAWLEAMACGLLAVAVRGQGPASFIRHGYSGLLVEPRDVADLKACLRRILRQEPGLRQLALQGQHDVTRNFSLERHAHKLAEVCTEAIGPRPAPGDLRSGGARSGTP